ncbi:MAG: hypothetical protein ACWGOX_14370, partial [Desulforhopalus sp.]
FSHGCIRVSQALDLALFCLQNEKGDWTIDKINQIIDEQNRRVVRLSSQLPVHITYQTVWFDKDGSIHFNDDIYGWDASLQEVLKNNQLRQGRYSAAPATTARPAKGRPPILLSPDTSAG